MAYCSLCNRFFKSERALQQHRDDSNMHYICYKCNMDFASNATLILHFTNSPQHPYCPWCDDHFGDYGDLFAHFVDAHFYCELCNLMFPFETALHEHRRFAHADDYCVPCKRMFKNTNALRHHERSTFHKGRTIDCPMKGCIKSFVSRAALVHHLESGGCFSRITRDMVNRIVAKLDTHGVISDPTKLIGPGSGMQVTGSWATARAWNGMRWECYLCHRTFVQMFDLNQHLNSPAHTQKGLYHCPTAWKGCGAKFNTLSGFCQHVESEQCGVCRFKKTMDSFIDGLSKGKKLCA
ncbi:hypothetical protein DICSQDRAFT_60528 [Dichomitus squalens LYAD-421 SS1]|uniref:C2H2-type domain-containing protein n=1 Tax=Dichomitus squalens (strain LYAD-421) TaxID=732165 RepID=R7T0E1_DICSQ|nr:uncharacterized protein DICSQDRAFT_60528 [Dichomitus squalens LYAD-421 SS1]EJF61460.1 hypothetical protein DICSQDRAFT_60528 [Dichomitus squalens LYAD-421 SS1]